MSERVTPDPEKGLSSLSTRPAPAGLKQRVLGSAREAKERAAYTPKMLAVGLACLVLIFAVSLADAALARSSEGRLRSFLNESGPKSTVEEDMRPLLLEIGAETTVFQARLSRRAIPEKDRLAVRDMLKGWDIQ